MATLLNKRTTARVKGIKMRWVGKAWRYATTVTGERLVDDLSEYFGLETAYDKIYYIGFLSIMSFFVVIILLAKLTGF